MRAEQKNAEAVAWEPFLRQADRGRRIAGARDDLPKMRAAGEAAAIAAHLAWAVAMIAGQPNPAIIGIGIVAVAVTAGRLKDSGPGLAAWLRSPSRPYLRGLEETAEKRPIEATPWPLIVQAQQLHCAGAAERQMKEDRSAGWAVEWHPQPVGEADRRAAGKLLGKLDAAEILTLAEVAASVDPQLEQRRHDCCRWCGSSAIELGVGELRRISRLGPEARQFLRDAASRSDESARHDNWHARWLSSPRGGLTGETIRVAEQLNGKEARVAAALTRSGSDPLQAAAAAAAALA